MHIIIIGSGVAGVSFAEKFRSYSKLMEHQMDAARVWREGQSAWV